jgi:hypothetical protein
MYLNVWTLNMKSRIQSANSNEKIGSLSAVFPDIVDANLSNKE